MIKPDGPVSRENDRTVPWVATSQSMTLRPPAEAATLPLGDKACAARIEDGRPDKNRKYRRGSRLTAPSRIVTMLPNGRLPLNKCVNLIGFPRARAGRAAVLLAVSQYQTVALWPTIRVFMVGSE